MMDESMLKKEVLEELMQFMDERVAEKLAKKKMGALPGEPVASKMEIEVESEPGAGDAIEKMKDAIAMDGGDAPEMEDDDEEEAQDEFGLAARLRKKMKG